jgi:hypothetical protein
MRDYGYSYEIYAPAGGGRIDYEDHFPTRRDAVAAMRDAMAQDGIPAGATAFVCRRYDNGETTDNVDYVKSVTITVRQLKTAV